MLNFAPLVCQKDPVFALKTTRACLEKTINKSPQQEGQYFRKRINEIVDFVLCSFHDEIKVYFRLNHKRKNKNDENQISQFYLQFVFQALQCLYHPCVFRLRFFLSFGLQTGSIRSSSSSGFVSSSGLISSCSSSVDGSSGTIKGSLF